MQSYRGKQAGMGQASGGKPRLKEILLIKAMTHPMQTSSGPHSLLRLTFGIEVMMEVGGSLMSWRLAPTCDETQEQGRIGLLVDGGIETVAGTFTPEPVIISLSLTAPTNNH